MEHARWRRVKPREEGGRTGQGVSVRGRPHRQPRGCRALAASLAARLGVLLPAAHACVCIHTHVRSAGGSCRQLAVRMLPATQSTQAAPLAAAAAGAERKARAGPKRRRRVTQVTPHRAGSGSPAPCRAWGTALPPPRGRRGQLHPPCPFPLPVTGRPP